MLDRSLHPVDVEYFKEFPSPIYEALTRFIPCEINGTTPHYGPLLYTLTKILGAGFVMEIGVASGWSSGFLSWGIKENNTRYAFNGRYYGIDCGNKDHIQAAHTEIGLPSTFIQDTRGSVHFLKEQKIFYPGQFDIIFIDGWHNNKYVLEETELCYPLLKGIGQGYLIYHDIYAFVEGAWPKIISRTAPDAAGVMRPAFEHVRFMNNYGLGICRKMEGYDHDKIHWPSGDQPDPECDV